MLEIAQCDKIPQSDKIGFNAKFDIWLLCIEKCLV